MCRFCKGRLLNVEFVFTVFLDWSLLRDTKCGKKPRINKRFYVGWILPFGGPLF
jgi:hypothetical protein